MLPACLPWNDASAHTRLPGIILTALLALWPMAAHAQSGEPAAQRGVEAYQKGDIEGALKHYDEALSLELDDDSRSLVLGHKATLLASQNRLDEAIPVGKEAARLTKDPEQKVKYLAMCATLHNRKGQRAQTLEAITAILKLRPDDASFFNTRGQLHFLEGNIAASISDFSDAIRLKPDEPEYLSNRATLLIINNKLDEAEKDITAALKLDPQHAETYNQRAQLHLKQGRLREALEDASKTIELNPRLATGWNSRASALVRLQRWDAALSDLRSAQRLDTGGHVTIQILATLLAACPDDKLRNGAEAVALAEEACKRTAWKNADCLMSLAAAHAETGDFTAALKIIEQAMALPGLSKEVVEKLQNCSLLYLQNKPFRLSPGMSI